MIITIVYVSKMKMSWNTSLKGKMKRAPMYIVVGFRLTISYLAAALHC